MKKTEKKRKSAGTSLVVGMDGKRAVENRTGLGNYSRYAVNILSLAYPSTSFALYAPRNPGNDRLSPLLARENVTIQTPALMLNNGVGRALWRSVDMPVNLRKDGIDVYHGLSNELPLTIKGVCPTVVTIHDVIWRRYPKDYSAIDRKLYDLKYGRSARIANRIIAISECTKRDIMAEFGIPEEKIEVIYQGVDPIFTLPVDTSKRLEIKERYALPKRYFITVGTVQGRKNQLLAVEGLAQLPEDVHLLIVGKMSGKYAELIRARIKDLGLTDRVHFPEVPFEDLPALYACAEFSSYTSRYEGFGLPVVESLSVGTPVIACSGSCLEEAGGEGALYVDPDNVEAYVRAALDILEKKGLREKLSEKGRRHVKKFTADNFAKQTMACYTRAILDFNL